MENSTSGAQRNWPGGLYSALITLDAAGNVYVADRQNNRFKSSTIRSLFISMVDKQIDDHAIAIDHCGKAFIADGGDQP